MSFVAGLDLSTFAVDVVLLDEDTDDCHWHKFTLEGATAWERTLRVPDAMPPSSFWDSTYLAAVERPFYRRDDSVRLVQGAVLACLPERLRQPHTLWEAHPSTWTSALGMKGKPAESDLFRLAPHNLFHSTPELFAGKWKDDQNRRDAFCIALWARDENARGVAA